MLVKTIYVIGIFLLIITNVATAQRYSASYVVPHGVSQVKVTYVKNDNTVVFDRIIEVDPDSKFTIRPVK
jgi:hypothetical protein